jgi:hypothetical protein
MTGPTIQDRVETLTRGADILAPALVPHGFSFHVTDSGHGSGGNFAVGDFIRGDRRLELHFRWSLGLVGYGLGKRAVGHEAYMWVVTGRRTGGSYPGASDSPLDGFECLRQDLVIHCSAFLSGTDAEFLNIITRADELLKWYASLSPLQKMDVD